MELKKIVIICYAFPPHPGIGGRRWAKFAKYLVRKGYNVSVIASENPYTDKVSEWNADVKGIQVTQLPLNFPKALITFPGGIAGKLRYRLSLLKVKSLSKGNYYDRTIFWRSQLVDAYKKLLQKEPVSHVIISGAPFSWFNFVEDLKRQKPDVQFIADIRDPWTSNESAYGYTSISPKRLQYEQSAEKTMLQDFDKIITVNEHIGDYFKKLNPQRSERVFTIPNGFDEEETKMVFPEDLSWDDSKINFVFAGSFYTNALYLFESLVASLDAMQKQGKQLPLRFYFFGPNMDLLKSKVPAYLADLFSFGYYRDLEYVNALITKANYTMLFLTDDINNSFSTKFCEYLKFRKKIVVFSKPGFTGNYVEKNDIGYFFDAGKITDALEKICKTAQPESFPAAYDANRFSLSRLTDELITVLK